MRAPGLLVVGSSGFIGRAVVDLMDQRDIPGVAVSRHGISRAGGTVRHFTTADYNDLDALSAAAAGCDAAIMLAARVHVMKEEERDPLAAFMRSNRDLPLLTAEALARAGGSRFVFVSSVAVNGVVTSERPFRESDPPAPVTAYGRSKLAAEEALKSLCSNLGLELVILRPPLVYGPCAPGNFGQLLRAAKLGIPLPLGSVHNRRDFVGIDNLADLLLFATENPAAAGQTFLVSDGQRTSTSAIVRSLYRATGYPRRVLPVSPMLIRGIAMAVGRQDIAARLLDDLTIDASHLFETLGWKPPFSLEEGLRRSVGVGSKLSGA